MKILVINCGSSSIKYQLLDMRSESDYSLLAKGNLEKISLPDSKITHKNDLTADQAALTTQRE